MAAMSFYWTGAESPWWAYNPPPPPPPEVGKLRGGGPPSSPTLVARDMRGSVETKAPGVHASVKQRANDTQVLGIRDSHGYANHQHARTRGGPPGPTYLQPRGWTRLKWCGWHVGPQRRLACWARHGMRGKSTGPRIWSWAQNQVSQFIFSISISTI
jgi:hypothetical protein